ncbi:response regulator transcription factor [Leifsonia sp. 1010]|uniref:response regulator transcription factor n=1 Tax=Leifsonia sp. 1010 TaxID=2817769 RepID=UPI00285B6BFD|nr:response regulator transcription factor [Leifsonia sp. 1010]MDR6611946.1 DNA-binding NarL/FixJ family response regulator [Leifsonia sp. 1010]
MIRVLVVDDQPLARAGISALVEAEPDLEVVGAAADGMEALRLVSELRPDVICLDIRMPLMDGIQVANRIAELDGPRPAILILTTFDIDDYVFRALEAGVAGFLLKDSEPDELVRAIRSIADGHGTLDRTLTRRIVDEYVHRRRLQPLDATAALKILTPRERDILLLLAQGMSNDEIAGTLVIEVATVKSHMARLLPKLGVRSRLQAVAWAYQNKVIAPS